MSRARRTVLEYRSYELSPDFPIVVLTGDKWHISPVPAKHLHFHNCLEVGLCHTGGGSMVFEQQSHHFSAGSVTCIARNIPHTTYSDPGTTSLWSYLFLDPEGLLGMEALGIMGLTEARNFLADCHLLLSGDSCSWASQLIEQIIREVQEKPSGYTIVVRSLCAALLIELLRDYAASDTEYVRDSYFHVICPALDYIHEHFMENVDVETLASACHMSQTHFRRIFKEQVGSSPLEFLHQTRILKSCALLRSSDMTVAEVASKVGYNSLCSFNRHFFDSMGSTPSTWRRSSGENLRPSLLTFTGWKEAEVMEEEDSGIPEKGDEEN